MRSNAARWALGVGLVAFGFAAPAAAQGTPTGDISAGYQFINVSGGGNSSEALPLGWYIDMSGNLTRSFAVVAEVGGNYKSITQSASLGGATASATADIKIHEFMGGIRVSSRANPKLVPFGHFLVGASQGSVSYSGTSSLGGQTVVSVSGTDSGTNFALQGGGGMIFEITKTFGVRVGADYLHIFATDTGANVFRFAAGVNFPL